MRDLTEKEIREIVENEFRDIAPFLDDNADIREVKKIIRDSVVFALTLTKT